MLKIWCAFALLVSSCVVAMDEEIDSEDACLFVADAKTNETMDLASIDWSPLCAKIKEECYDRAEYYFAETYKCIKFVLKRPHLAVIAAVGLSSQLAVAAEPAIVAQNCTTNCTKCTTCMCYCSWGGTTYKQGPEFGATACHALCQKTNANFKICEPMFTR